MAKKKSWFSQLKRLFLSETHSKPEKEEKRRRWMFGRLKIKRLAATSPSRERNLCETEEEQSKHAVTVAIATAAAAEAAVAAAQAAAEVVWLTANPQCEWEIQDLAATKIQTAFRGYLARKALRALKGVVRLQAIIRGRAVRRHAITTLKCLQSIVNIQSQVCARRCQMVDDFKDNEIKIDYKRQTRRDGSILSKEEANTQFLSKRDSVIKREQQKEEYALSHRRSEVDKLNGSWRHRLEQWVDTKTPDTVFSSTREEFGERKLKVRNTQRQYYYLEEGLMDSPRRSFHHRKQRSIGGDVNTPLVPTYMAATESAKAKARSFSSPRLRPLSLDSYSETNSPYKHKLSPINSQVIICNTTRIGFQQRSPCLKSNSTLKNRSFDSDCSLPNWGTCAFR
uniref:DUF4005 domain-containing protein n=1 Tax=Davidia involucrata TaxID=16924 RepID=A0A5B6ZKC0_DAVIN